MTPQQAIETAAAGQLLPMYLVVGEEEHLRTEVVSALRRAVQQGNVPGLNDDQFTAGETDVGTILAVARTLPMMARRRGVLVRGLERWEANKSSKGQDPLDQLAEFSKQATPETTLILTGGKLDKRRRLFTTARKEGWLVLCEPLTRQELPRWIEEYTRSQGGRLAAGTADLVAELSGPELASVKDALDRLVLYAHDETIGEEHVAACLVRLRAATVWDLVNAVACRNLPAALRALDESFDAKEAPRLVGLLAWSTRQLLRFEAATAAGVSPAEAAQEAGAAPFKARELTAQVRTTTRARLERWLRTLSEVDLGIKGGSKRTAKAVFEHAIIQACTSGNARLRERGFSARA